MSRFLLDTKVISEIVRPRRSANVVKWIEAADESILHISVLTLGEIRKGIALLSDGRRRMSVESWFDKDLAHRFSGRILSIDRAIAERWGRISAHAKATGSPLPVIDRLLSGGPLIMLTGHLPFDKYVSSAKQRLLPACRYILSRLL